MTENDKRAIKRDVVACLQGEPEVLRIVLFGSFNQATDPGDMDLAIVQDSPESYMPLALKYRKALRPVARRIALDVLPVREQTLTPDFAREIARGEILYERPA